MCREIKFRAWDKIRHEMIEDLQCRISINSDGSVNDCGSYIELMQYTGLKDKNGVEIYEGDIVSDFTGNFVIGWSECRLAWIIEHEETEYYEQVSKQGILEVIGNIYENKELLNV